MLKVTKDCLCSRQTISAWNFANKYRSKGIAYQRSLIEWFFSSMQLFVLIKYILRLVILSQGSSPLVLKHWLSSSFHPTSLLRKRETNFIKARGMERFQKFRQLESSLEILCRKHLKCACNSNPEGVTVVTPGVGVKWYALHWKAMTYFCACSADISRIVLIFVPIAVAVDSWPCLATFE